MSWGEFHRKSEEYADAGDMARWRGDVAVAKEQYRIAAVLEEQALAGVDVDDPRTYGITAVSAAALYFKAEKHDDSNRVAKTALNFAGLSEHLLLQLKEIIDNTEKYLKKKLNIEKKK